MNVYLVWQSLSLSLSLSPLLQSSGMQLLTTAHFLLPICSSLSSHLSCALVEFLLLYGLKNWRVKRVAHITFSVPCWLLALFSLFFLQQREICWVFPNSSPQGLVETIAWWLKVQILGPNVPWKDQNSKLEVQFLLKGMCFHTLQVEKL
jgi:hypothetical protein